MNIIIYDDNRDFSDSLKNIIYEHANPTYISLVYNNDRLKTLENIREDQPVIVFLDIIFSGKAEGFLIARQLEKYRGKRKLYIIFITDYPNKILNNTYFKLRAINTIYKKSPYFKEEVGSTLQYIEDRINNECLIYHIDSYEYQAIYKRDITYITTAHADKKILINSLNGRYVISGSLKKILPQLDTRFYQCHRWYIVNIHNISSIDKKTKTIIFVNGDRCYYSLGKGGGFKNAVARFIDEQRRDNLCIK